MFVNNITAEILGTNSLLRTTSRPPPLDRTNLFVRPEPTNILERSWEQLIESIYYSELGTGGSADSSGGEVLPRQWLEGQLLPIFNATTLPGSKDEIYSPTTIDRTTTLESFLERLTALSYGIIVQNFRSQTRDKVFSVSSSWKPVMAMVVGKRQTVRGLLNINGLQLFIGTACSIMLVLAVSFALATPSDEEQGNSHGVKRDGGVIDLMSLVDQSSLPSILVGRDPKETTDQQRRAIAERTSIACVYSLCP